MEYIIKYNDATIVISKVSNNGDSICKGKSDDATIGTDPPSKDGISSDKDENRNRQ